MSLVRTLAVGLAACAACLSCTHPMTETLTHGFFKDVTVYHPQGPVRQFVLLLSGDGGWQADTDRMARVLQDRGAMVAGIDEPKLLAELDKDPSPCVFPDGDLENLSHFVQAYYHLPAYLPPVLGGYSAGASVAYAVAAQAPPGLFIGALTLGFTPDLVIHKPLCEGEGQHFRRQADGVKLLPAERLPIPWIDIHGEADTVCPARDAVEFARGIHGAKVELIAGVGHDFRDPRQWSRQLLAALDTLTHNQATEVQLAPLSLKDLPLVEVPATGTGHEDVFAILISGDGGWAGIDKQVAAALADQGVPVAGWDSLRYFWTPRTPEGLATDLARTLHYYAETWHRPHVLLIGYSQGADVLPFAVNRLPAAARKGLLTTTLLGLGRQAAFEFHLSNWVGPVSGLPIRPELARMPADRTLCVYGTGDTDSVCADLGPGDPEVVQLPGGHHFDGDYAALAKLILERAAKVKDAAGLGLRGEL